MERGPIFYTLSEATVAAVPEEAEMDLRYVPRGLVVWLVRRMGVGLCGVSCVRQGPSY
jgi:hypothetical protein